MSFNRFVNARVRAVQCVVPHICIPIEAEHGLYEDDERKLSRYKNILGLSTRYVLAENETNEDLARYAVKLLLEKEQLDPKSIDTIINTSSTHDYIGACDACIMQDEFGFSEETACIDTAGLGCTDAVYALWLAHCIVESGASKRCLVVESSCSSKFCHPQNFNTKILFGDGAAAVLVEKSEFDTEACFYMGSKGSGWKSIVIPAGGLRLPIEADLLNLEVKDKSGNLMHLYETILKGGAVFEFAMDEGPSSIDKLLKFAGKTVDDVDFFAIHQANAQIVRVVMTRAGIPQSKGSAETFSKFANCSGTSVLLNLCDQRSERKNGLIAAVTFGLGLSKGSCLLDLSDCAVYPVANLPEDFKAPTRAELIQEWSDYIRN